MRTLLLLVSLIIFGCSNSEKMDLKEFDLGEFYISLPKDSRLENLNSTDSYAAKIKSDGLELQFDFGLYAPKMVLTEKEFWADETWRYEGKLAILCIMNPMPIFLEIERIYDSLYRIKVDARECLRNDSCSYYKIKEAFDLFLLKDSVFTADLILHPKIENYDFYISEENSVYQKIFISKEVNKFKSGLYLVDKNSCADEHNCEKQLSLWTSGSTKIDTASLIKIFRSVRFK
jgi:hypothetical protein